MQRRREIYALCQQYDIIIVEDDPYWYLQYPSARTEPVPTPPKSSGYAFLDSLMPSYLSLDVDGRVVRLDTFSKTIAPGCRLGWVTAQPAIIERLLRITETSTQQPSGFVQGMVAELVVGPLEGGNGKGGMMDGKGWAVDGWEKEVVLAARREAGSGGPWCGGRVGRD
jgi:DNA-binding transcriptional MocR family regulator